MRLDAALSKIGVSIVDQKVGASELTIFLRVDHKHPKYDCWRRSIEEFLLAHAERKTPWSPDISRMYFASKGSVKYLWRVIIRAPSKSELQKGLETFANAIIRSLQQSVEITSMPLVGRVQYQHDPAKGKLKGAHDLGSAGKNIAATGGPTT